MVDLVDRGVGGIEEETPSSIIISSHLNILHSKDAVPIVTSNHGILEDVWNDVEAGLAYYSAICESWVEMLHKVPHFVELSCVDEYDYETDELNLLTGA